MLKFPMTFMVREFKDLRTKKEKIFYRVCLSN